MRCPRCNYTLALNTYKRRYKCSRCGRVFRQNKLELDEFIKFNKQEREKESTLFEKELEREAQYRAVGKAPSKFEHADLSILKRIKWSQENKELILKRKEEYYRNHRQEIIIQKRAYRANLSGHQKLEDNIKRRLRRNKNIERTRLLGRINYWKMRQKALAKQYFNSQEN